MANTSGSKEICGCVKVQIGAESGRIHVIWMPLDYLTIENGKRGKTCRSQDNVVSNKNQTWSWIEVDCFSFSVFFL